MVIPRRTDPGFPGVVEGDVFLQPLLLLPPLKTLPSLSFPGDAFFCPRQPEAKGWDSVGHSLTKGPFTELLSKVHGNLLEGPVRVKETIFTLGLGVGMVRGPFETRVISRQMCYVKNFDQPVPRSRKTPGTDGRTRVLSSTSPEVQSSRPDPDETLLFNQIWWVTCLPL